MMNFIQEYRASKILYNFLKANLQSKCIVLPANVCEVLPLICTLAGVQFVFADIDKTTLCLDKWWLLQNAKRIDAVLYVHTYGVENTPTDLFLQLKQQNENLLIIDDRCLCEPTIVHYFPEAVDLICYSLGYGKQVDMSIGAFGYIANHLKYYSFENKYSDSFDDYKNSLLKGEKPIIIDFLDNINFTLDQQRLKKCKENAIKHRMLLNQLYTENLPQSIQLMADYQHWRFNILLDNNQQRDNVIKSIFNHGHFVSSHYHSMAKYWHSQICMNTELLQSKIINLFNDYHYSEESALKLCHIINEAL